MSAVALKDKPGVQMTVRECEAQLSAARAFMFEAMDAVETELRNGRDLPSGPATQHARLACVFAADVSRRIVDELHTTAGTSAARMDRPAGTQTARCARRGIAPLGIATTVRRSRTHLSRRRSRCGIRRWRRGASARREIAQACD